MRHTFEAHGCDPNVRFTCRYCPQTFTKYSSMTSHLSRKHRQVVVEDESEEAVNNSPQSSLQIISPDDNQAMDIQQHSDVDRLFNSQTGELPVACSVQRQHLQRSAALFLLTMKERYKLTQTAVDFAVNQVKNMVTYALQDMQATVQQGITSGVETTDAIDMIGRSIDPFEDLHTEYKQTKFYKENFNLVVRNVIIGTLIQLLLFHIQEPVTIELETCLCSGPRGNIMEQKITFQYVPLLESLKALLSNQEVLDEVSQLHISLLMCLNRMHEYFFLNGIGSSFTLKNG